MSESSYRIPCTTSELYDLYDGLGVSPENQKQTDDEKYRKSLEIKFNKDLYIDVIMSVQNKISFEFIEVLALTFNGTCFQHTIYSIYTSIFKHSTYDSYVELKCYLEYYKNAMKSL
ncbi:hypothetical protein [Methanosphaera sp.]